MKPSTWGINEIDQESVAVLFLRDPGQILLRQLVVHGHGRRLDGDASVLLILTSVRKTSFAGFSTCEEKRQNEFKIALWSRTTKNPDVSTGPPARMFVPIAHSQAHGKMNY